jgi:glutaminyl-peptide cyclotransferase
MLLRTLVGTLLLATGCQGPARPAPETDGDAALAYVRTQLEFGPRIPGTEGHRRMAAWLDSLLRVTADSVVVQSWEHTALDGTVLPLRNYIARFNPGATERILFLAHWDTRPVADGPASRDRKAPVPGANDGASGVAVLLAMADAFKRSPPAIGVDLLFVDGEDYGSFSEDRDVLIGSRYYALNPLPGPKPLFAVLYDMVGDAEPRYYQEGFSLTAAPEAVELVWRTAAEMGHGDIFVAEPGISVTDDHIPLQQAGFRAIDVIDFDYGPGNKWWHTPDDSLDKISAASLKVAADVGVAVVRKHGR